ncbi:putative Macro domain containing protein [Trypanosoma cruzi]|uniref:Macro domain-containing protein n=2 Tax=Trypanosoma cruzi TaxID=5693 RepID=Q4DSL4_TRYCC|nr:hypothetical protein, conserved [Trypanosoma cruzi]EAN95517.1 hypothetical protein, conserved [Trypanosoma cruzi]PWV16330.1 putative Macro domain containing protein [Trypanosoma cruzi]RNC57405.1 Appr-1-p processing domain-containing protein [Trypanosoma cruzi]|eukprot:XP_817368.1 hypothetical protein [Trypanosoma cruzi strain CL Brener]
MKESTPPPEGTPEQTTAATTPSTGKGCNRAMEEVGKEGQSAKFVTYSTSEPAQLSGEARRRSHFRARVLEATLSPLEKAIFDVPLEEWLTVDRSKFLGWRCAVPHPVTADELKPVDPSHDILRHIALHNGPVTDLQLDAIVNAANKTCLGGKGVDGAIHAAAGPLLVRECATFNGCDTGQCRITKGYNLPARYVLHTVGPIGERPEALRSCYRSILSLAHRNRLRSIGFCCVSTGVYGYPLIPATRIAVDETIEYLKQHFSAFDLCCFACFKLEEYNAYTDCLRAWLGTAPNASSDQ